MENKKINQVESELIDQLLAVVNSEEEFLNLIAEKTRLFSYLILLKGGTQKW